MEARIELPHEFSWERNEMKHVQHLAWRLAHSKCSNLGQLLFILLVVFLTSDLLLLRIMLADCLIFDSLLYRPETWSTKRSIKGHAWLAVRKRCDQKVVLEALSALSLWLDHFSAKADIYYKYIPQDHKWTVCCATFIWINLICLESCPYFSILSFPTNSCQAALLIIFQAKPGLNEIKKK